MSGTKCNVISGFYCITYVGGVAGTANEPYDVSGFFLDLEIVEKNRFTILGILNRLTLLRMPIFVLLNLSM